MGGHEGDMEGDMEREMEGVKILVTAQRPNYHFRFDWD